MNERGFLLHGRVQGVGFRWWTRKTAESLGVVGTVKNLADGSVRVMARAEKEVLDRFADKLRKGPSMARVESVEEVTCRLPDGIDAFRIEH